MYRIGKVGVSIRAGWNGGGWRAAMRLITGLP